MCLFVLWIERYQNKLQKLSSLFSFSVTFSIFLLFFFTPWWKRKGKRKKKREGNEERLHWFYPCRQLNIRSQLFSFQPALTWCETKPKIGGCVHEWRLLTAISCATQTNTIRSWSWEAPPADTTCGLRFCRKKPENTGNDNGNREMSYCRSPHTSQFAPPNPPLFCCFLLIWKAGVSRKYTLFLSAASCNCKVKLRWSGVAMWQLVENRLLAVSEEELAYQRLRLD